MLTKGGWIGAISIALIILLGFGYKFLILPFGFLVLGSFVSKINNNEKDKYRDIVQVLSNGGVALIISVFYIITPNQVLVNAFILSFAIALSDTFSSELGKYLNGYTIDIIKLQKVKRGLSGGISIEGTLAGIIGSFIIAVLSVLIIEINVINILEITTFGIIGMLIDSVFGSTIQAKYLIGEEISEEGKNEHLIAGYHRIDNNIVNFLSILITVCIYLVLQ